MPCEQRPRGGRGEGKWSDVRPGKRGCLVRCFLKPSSKSNIELPVFQKTQLFAGIKYGWIVQEGNTVNVCKCIMPVILIADNGVTCCGGDRSLGK